MMYKVNFQGKSRIKYEFGIFRLDEEFPDEPGVYFLVQEHQPIRSGVTESLREEVEIMRKECNLESCHIYFHLRYDKIHCEHIEQDLLKDNESQEVNGAGKKQFVFVM